MRNGRAALAVSQQPRKKFGKGDAYLEQTDTPASDACDGLILLAAARLYPDQATNFQAPDGGLAVLFTVQAMN